MNVSKARSEVQRMLLPFQALKSLEEVLDTAERVEAERTKAETAVKTATEKLMAIKADTELASTQYAQQEIKGSAALDALKSAMAAAEKAHQEKLDGYNAQISKAQADLDALKAYSLSEKSRLEQEAQAQERELNGELQAMRAIYETQEKAAKDRLADLKEQIDTLVKRVTG